MTGHQNFLAFCQLYKEVYGAFPLLEGAFFAGIKRFKDQGLITNQDENELVSHYATLNIHNKYRILKDLKGE